jgi:hypothetical protein
MATRHAAFWTEPRSRGRAAPGGEQDAPICVSCRSRTPQSRCGPYGNRLSRWALCGPASTFLCASCHSNNIGGFARPEFPAIAHGSDRLWGLQLSGPADDGPMRGRHQDALSSTAWPGWQQPQDALCTSEPPAPVLSPYGLNNSDALSDVFSQGLYSDHVAYEPPSRGDEVRRAPQWASTRDLIERVPPLPDQKSVAYFGLFCTKEGD